VGPAGTARAYAVVEPTSPTAATLIAGQTSNITAVTEPMPGVYCLTAVGVNPATDAAAVSPEVSYSSGGAPGVVAVNAQHTNCAPGQFEVDTFTLMGAPSSNYAFTIVAP
jgi:hypothetical protein